MSSRPLLTSNMLLLPHTRTVFTACLAQCESQWSQPSGGDENGRHSQPRNSQPLNSRNRERACTCSYVCNQVFISTLCRHGFFRAWFFDTVKRSNVQHSTRKARGGLGVGREVKVRGEYRFLVRAGGWEGRQGEEVFFLESKGSEWGGFLDED